MLIKFIDRIQDKYSFYENILLIEERSEDRALGKAAIRAKEDECAEEDEFAWESRPATLEFAGIRKLISCEDFGERPHSGMEITYSQMEVGDRSSLIQFLEGEEVDVKYSN